MSVSEELRSVKILFVDDEVEILNALERQLSIVPGIDAYFESDPTNVLSIIEEEDIGVVISDIVMPKMDGISLLQKIKKEYPEVVRILLTAHGDPDTSLRAIEEAEVFGFITKPWSKHYLLGYLEMARKQVDETMVKLHTLDTPFVIKYSWDDEDGARLIMTENESHVDLMDQLSKRIFMSASGMFGKKYRFGDNLFTYPVKDCDIVIRGYLTTRGDKNLGVFYVASDIDPDDLKKIDEKIKSF